MNPARHISISINRSPADTYDFVSNPENLSLWASGLSGSPAVRSGNGWVRDSPMGQVKIVFADRNAFGVVDHDVTLALGEVNHNPFRVLPNDSGSEVVFTLYRLPKMSERDFEEDAAVIGNDLEALKRLLER